MCESSALQLWDTLPITLAHVTPTHPSKTQLKALLSQGRPHISPQSDLGTHQALLQPPVLPSVSFLTPNCLPWVSVSPGDVKLPEAGATSYVFSFPSSQDSAWHTVDAS